MEYEHIFDKIVVKRRGEYCFELNILDAELLKSIGFSIQPVLGRVWLSKTIASVTDKLIIEFYQSKYLDSYIESLDRRRTLRITDGILSKRSLID